MKPDTMPFDGTMKRLYIARGRVSDETGRFLSDLHGCEIQPGVVAYVFDAHIGEHYGHSLDVRFFLDPKQRQVIKGMEDKPWIRDLDSEEQQKVLEDLRTDDDSTLLFVQNIGGNHHVSLDATAQQFLETARLFANVKNLGFVTPALPNIQSDRAFTNENMIPHFPRTAKVYGDLADSIFSFVYHSTNNITDCENIHPGKFHFLTPAPIFDHSFRETLGQDEYNNAVIVSLDGGNKLYLDDEAGNPQNMPASVARCVELLNARHQTNIPTNVPYADIEDHPIVKEFLVIFGKERPKKDETHAEIIDPMEEIASQVKGRLCIVHDDIVNSAGSAIAIAKTLRALKASKVVFSARNAVLPIFYGDPVTDPDNSEYSFRNASQRLLLSSGENGKPLIDHTFLLHSLRKLPRMIAQHLSFGDNFDDNTVAEAKDRLSILSSNALTLQACVHMWQRSRGIEPTPLHALKQEIEVLTPGVTRGPKILGLS